MIKQLTKRALESALDGALTDNLGYSAHDPTGRVSGNSRNGKGSKRLRSTGGALDIKVPRDRIGSFEPQIVRKRQRKLAGLDDKIMKRLSV